MEDKRQKTETGPYARETGDNNNNTRIDLVLLGLTTANHRRAPRPVVIGQTSIHFQNSSYARPCLMLDYLHVISFSTATACWVLSAVAPHRKTARLPVDIWFDFLVFLFFSSLLFFFSLTLAFYSPITFPLQLNLQPDDSCLYRIPTTV